MLIWKLKSVPWAMSCICPVQHGLDTLTLVDTGADLGWFIWAIYQWMVYVIMIYQCNVRSFWHCCWGICKLSLFRDNLIAQFWYPCITFDIWWNEKFLYINSVYYVWEYSKFIHQQIIAVFIVVWKYQFLKRNTAKYLKFTMLSFWNMQNLIVIFGGFHFICL